MKKHLSESAHWINLKLNLILTLDRWNKQHPQLITPFYSRLHSFRFVNKRLKTIKCYKILYHTRTNSSFSPAKLSSTIFELHFYHRRDSLSQVRKSHGRLTSKICKLITSNKQLTHSTTAKPRTNHAKQQPLFVSIFYYYCSFGNYYLAICILWRAHA